MKLKKPCVHGRYDRHWQIKTAPGDWCPGGEFLADDALIIEKVDGEWPPETVEVIGQALWDSLHPTSGLGNPLHYRVHAVALLDTLTVADHMRRDDS